MPQHAGWERLRDRVQGHSALARFQGARSPLAEFEAAPQAAPGKAPAQKSATKLRCFARCERCGERRGAVKGSAALQFRQTRVDRSREPLLKCELSMLQTGGSAPLPGRGLYAHSRNRPCGLPVRIFDSVCELVGTPAGSLPAAGALRPRTPDRQGAGADGGSAALQFRPTTIDRICELVGTRAGCLRRPGRFAPLRARTERPCPRPGRYAPCSNRRLRVFFSKPEYIFSDFIIY